MTESMKPDGHDEASDPLEDEVLSRVRMSRRAMVRTVVAGTAFAVPMLSSFDMRSLSAADADAYSPNQAPCGLICTILRILRHLLFPTATLIRADTGAPVVGATVIFLRNGKPFATAVTNRKGVAKASKKMTRRGDFTATFVGDHKFAAATDVAPPG